MADDPRPGFNAGTAVAEEDVARSSFESAMRLRGLDRAPNGEYRNTFLQEEWEVWLEAWQARAALAAPKAEAWQDISTAPKDGTHILLGYAPDETYEDGFVSQGYWMDGDDDGPDNMGHDAGFVDVHFDFFRCARSFGAEAYRHAGTQPTHWMPLPAPPAHQGATHHE